MHLLVNKRLWWYQDARCNEKRNTGWPLEGSILSLGVSFFCTRFQLVWTGFHPTSRSCRSDWPQPSPNFITYNSTVMTMAAFFSTVLLSIRKTTQWHSTEGNNLFQRSTACAYCLIYAVVHQTVLSHCFLKQLSRAGRTADQECRNLIGMREMFMHHGLCRQKIIREIILRDTKR